MLWHGSPILAVKDTGKEKKESARTGSLSAGPTSAVFFFFFFFYYYYLFIYYVLRSRPVVVEKASLYFILSSEINAYLK